MAKKKIVITPEQEELLQKIAKVISDKGMTTPTIFFLESMQPLNFIGSQAMAYLEPFLTFVINRDNYNNIQKIMEQRQGIDYFLTILEDVEYKKEQKDRAIKELLKQNKPLKSKTAWQKLKFWQKNK